MITGIQILLDMLTGYGVQYIFGNPGTTELPLNDALADDRRFQYILAPQEVPAVAIADGYAQASRQPAVVNLHICCGLGNAMGMIYNAYREGTPLIVTAGQQDQRMLFEEPILWGRMVDAVRPWTKWADEVRRVEDLPSAVRRAMQSAVTPPTGPVFLSLPLDVQTNVAEVDASVPPPINPWTEPPAEAVRQAAKILSQAKNPGILVGSRVCEADAVAELVAVAESLGAPVMHEATTSHGRCSFPSNHPLAAEHLPFWSPEVRKRLAQFDVLLIAGMKLMQQYIYHEPARPLPEQVRLVQFDEDPWELNKNYPLAVGVLGHLKVSLSRLAAALTEMSTPKQRREAETRQAKWVQKRKARQDQLRREAAAQWDLRPMTPLSLMESLARVLPANAAVIEEAPTTTMGGYFEQVGALQNTDGYFAQRGWALGWGLNFAIGVKLAWPERPVLALIGDGSAMYGIQGLWTAARYRIPVTFVLCNNRQYKILKDCAEVLGLSAACDKRYEGLDLTDPAIDYVALAESLGVSARRVDDPDALSEAVQQSLKNDRPELIEVSVRHPAEK